MFFVATALVLFLVNVNIQSAYQEELPPMRKTYERINERYNPDMEWKRRLAKDAEKESGVPRKLDPKWYLKVQGSGNFRDATNLEEKVEIVLNNTLEGKGLKQNVTLLPPGTQYGCGGVYFTMNGAAGTVMNVACVYTFDLV